MIHMKGNSVYSLETLVNTLKKISFSLTLARENSHMLLTWLSCRAIHTLWGTYHRVPKVEIYREHLIPIRHKENDRHRSDRDHGMVRRKQVSDIL